MVWIIFHGHRRLFLRGINFSVLWYIVSFTKAVQYLSFLLNWKTVVCYAEIFTSLTWKTTCLMSSPVIGDHLAPQLTMPLRQVQLHQVCCFRRFMQIVSVSQYLSKQSSECDPKGMVCILSNLDANDLRLSLRLRHVLASIHQEGQLILNQWILSLLFWIEKSLPREILPRKWCSCVEYTKYHHIVPIW